MAIFPTRLAPTPTAASMRAARNLFPHASASLPGSGVDRRHGRRSGFVRISLRAVRKTP
jgi:hypothetical protein